MAVCCTLPPDTDGSDLTRQSDRARQWLNLGIAVLLASQVMVISFAINLSPIANPWRWILHTVLITSTFGVFLLVGGPLVREAWLGGVERRIVIEQLFLLGILGAFVASLISSFTHQGAVYYEVVSILLGIYVFGKLLAEQRRENVELATFQLTRQFSRCQRLAANGTWEAVDSTLIQVGDTILLPAGEPVAIDGRVIQGVAYVRETPLTGEPFPVVKRPGDQVLAGSEVIDADLTILSTVRGGRRKLDQLLESIRQARLAPSSLQREADRIMSWFLPLVLTASVLTMLYWLRRESWTTALFRSMSVLLVACPCAMGLATPIAFWGALSALVRRGWRVKSADFIQRAAAVDVVVFDKTGTLSEESLKLMDFIVLGAYSREELLAWILKIQAVSTHPVARAFQATPPTAGYSACPFDVSEIHILPAIGIQATVELLGHSRQPPQRLQIELGNHSLLRPHDLAGAELLRQQLKSNESTHEVWVKVAGKLCGLAQLRETLRAGAREAFAQLDRMGIKVQIMTGDTAASAARLGIPQAQTSLSPTDKAERVKECQRQGHRVLFIGDGLNDAAALAEAHASLTPSHAAELAQSSSQAVIHDLHWGSVPQVLQLARQTVHGIRFNLLFAAAYNLIGMTLAASGLLHPVASALLMLAASTTVTARALTFAENIQLPLHLRKKTKTWRQSLSEKGRALNLFSGLICLGFLFQALLLDHLAASLPSARLILAGITLTLIFLTCNYWTTIQRTPLLQMIFGMLSVGNLGMLLGWWADQGFTPMLLGGHLRSCCLARETQTFTLWHLSYMQLGMILGSFPFMLFLQDPKRQLLRNDLDKWWHALLGSVGMLLGMALATLLFRGVPELEAQTYFYLYHLAMTIGMLLGMLAFCGLWRLRDDTSPLMTTGPGLATELSSKIDVVQ